MAKKDFVFFWKTSKGRVIGPGCLSQWARYGFVVDGVFYRYAEQFMMAEKARLFHDDIAYNKVMDARSPMIMKHVGRSVRGYDERTWEAHRFNAVVRGNFAKFSQNEELKKYLLSTGSAVLAEASPKDKIWGIGLDAETAAKIPEMEWPGQNLLGKALMRVREMLARGEGETPEVNENKRQLREYEDAEISERNINSELGKLHAPQKTVKKSTARVVNRSNDPTPSTDANFGRELQAASVQMNAFVLEMDNDNANAARNPFCSISLREKFDAREKALQNQFDRLYRGYVYRQLLKPIENGGLYGFKRATVNGEVVPVLHNLSGAEVFAAVWAKLFGVRYNVRQSGKKKKRSLKSYFVAFDFSQKNVGKGAFRAYLNEIIYSVFRELMDADLVPLKDVHGHVMHDKRGKPIFVPRYQIEEDEKKLINPFSKPNVSPNDRRRVQLRLEIAFLSYYRLSADENLCPEWFKPAAKAIFERHEAAADVKKVFVEKKKAPSARAFDTELCRFRQKVRKLTDKLMEKVWFADERACKVAGEARSRRALSQKKALDLEWDELARLVGDLKMRSIRYNVVRGILDL